MNFCRASRNGAPDRAPFSFALQLDRLAAPQLQKMRHERLCPIGFARGGIEAFGDGLPAPRDV